MYKNKGLILLCLLAVFTQSFMAAAQKIKHTNKPQVWLTDADSAIKFKLHNQSILPISQGKNKPIIIVNPARPYQQMGGFGFALTGGSAMLIHKMNEPQQDSL